LRHEIIEIDPNAVRTDSRFAYTRGVADDELVESVRRFGLLALLLVTGDGPRDLVAGAKRLDAVKRLNVPRVMVLKLTGEPDDLLATALEDNRCFRELTGGEKARLARLLIDRWSLSPGDVADRWARPAGVIAEAGSVRALAECAADATLLAALDDGLVDERTAGEMLALSAPARGALVAQALRAVRLTRSECRECVRMLVDLTAVGQADPQNPLQDKEFREILADDEADAKRRGSALIDALRRRRFPELTGRRTQLAEAARALRSRCGAQVRYDPSFETKRVEIVLEARDSDALREAAEKLARVLDEPTARALFRPLEE